MNLTGLDYTDFLNFALVLDAANEDPNMVDDLDRLITAMESQNFQYISGSFDEEEGWVVLSNHIGLKDKRYQAKAWLAIFAGKDLHNRSAILTLDELKKFKTWLKPNLKITVEGVG
jgi:hypothetical protein